MCHFSKTLELLACENTVTNAEERCQGLRNKQTKIHLS